MNSIRNCKQKSPGCKTNGNKDKETQCTQFTLIYCSSKTEVNCANGIHLQNEFFDGSGHKELFNFVKNEFEFFPNFVCTASLLIFEFEYNNIFIFLLWNIIIIIINNVNIHFGISIDIAIDIGNSSEIDN